MEPSIPLGLQHAMESGDCVLFIGAGIGPHMLGPGNKPAPTATELARELKEHFSIDAQSEDLAQIATVIDLRKGRPPLEDFLRKRLANLEPDAQLRWLLSRRWRAIFTTNYDSCIERAYELNDQPLQRAVPISVSSDLVSYDPRLDVPIYHLHGTLYGAHQNSIVISEKDYARFRESRRMLFAMLKLSFATTPILYVGYSNRDPNWKLVLDELEQDFYPSVPPTSFRVAPTTDALESEILRSKNIETVPATFEQFSLVCSASISPSLPDPSGLATVRALVPAGLITIFENAPAATTRLLASWGYVNGAPFSAASNMSAFLGGDRPTWGLIGRREHVTRDIEEDVFDDILDYVTGSPVLPSSVIVLGPAGFGVTTVLMSIAARLVQEKAGPVFMHKPGAPLRQGDILFAASMLAGPVIFIVDDAADCCRELEEGISQLRAQKRQALFVLGERLNEWRQRRPRIPGPERLIEPLSDTEIDNLLNCLGRNGALNKLDALPRDLQVAAIKERHGKQLLVVLKEATEGKGFDAILEDEFRGLKNEIAQSAYLAVCCIYQHGAYVRDDLLSRVCRLDLPSLYAETKDVLDGVVIYETIDEALGIYAARARHRTVATVVWERCGDISERDRILQLALESLNLNYGADLMAFEKLVRSDRLVDGIRGLEAKVRFFETACRKEPDNPYVRQHYARMLSRENQLDLALGQIEQALSIGKGQPPRVLFHTRGMILTQLTTDTESEGIARKRLVQAEESFRRCIALNRRDEYGYQGLARLYLAWAKRVAAENEAMEYAAKAEEVIGDGLRNVKDREALWIVTSEVQQWLGNTPARLHALERAIAANPGGTIARYVLGRTYRQLGQPTKALETLAPLVKGNPQEYRAFIEYALVLLMVGQPLAEAIAVMNMATTFGLSDSRFVATLGGLYFLSGNFSEANKVFMESVRQELPYQEAQAVHFRPSTISPAIALELKGRVTALKPGIAIIDVEGYPRLMCRRHGGAGSSALRVRMEVQVSVAFSARGPAVEKVQVV